MERLLLAIPLRGSAGAGAVAEPAGRRRRLRLESQLVRDAYGTDMRYLEVRLGNRQQSRDLRLGRASGYWLFGDGIVDLPFLDSGCALFGPRYRGCRNRAVLRLQRRPVGLDLA